MGNDTSVCVWGNLSQTQSTHHSLCPVTMANQADIGEADMSWM